MLKERKVGIYVRLSKEDDHFGESASIENQKLLLTKHVVEQGWTLVEVYSDDGFSGTNQNRPALQKMLEDVEQGYINMILVKDLSRLGRNYLEVGNLAEVFLPEHDCELVSLSEKVDEMMVFRNWFNEQHSRETSKKVRAVKKMHAENGRFLGAFAPYGYKKSSKDKHLLVPDEKPAAIVREIFKLRSEGMGHKAIADHLNNSGVPSPRDHYYKERDGENPFRTSHKWSCVTIKNILDSEVYIGNTVSLKYGTISYKNHRLTRKSKDEWVRVKGTHEPIIDDDLWKHVQEVAAKRYRPHRKKDGSVSIFCGLLLCEQCGFKMRSVTQKRIRKSGVPYEHTSFMCGTYSRSGKTACSPHTISEKELHQIVLEKIKKHAELVVRHEESVTNHILKARLGETAANHSAMNTGLSEVEMRLEKLDNLAQKLYEDRLEGLITEETFKNLIWKCWEEIAAAQQEKQSFESLLRSFAPYEQGVRSWVSLMKQYAQIQSLDAKILLLLVGHIVIGDRTETGERNG